jgi:uncharacterized protein (UPF0332 family)
MSIVDDLIEQGNHLINRDERRPKQANLRRAVSSAYYAIFHEVNEKAVRHITSGQVANTPIGQRIRRTVSHKAMKDAASWFSNQPTKAVQYMRGTGAQVNTDLAFVCDIIIELQGERHRADYDLATPVVKLEAKRLVADAERAIQRFRLIAADDTDRSIFLLGCLFGSQLGKNL